jgi:D-beta-D-heptose 7-phosphate kinase/D-beta-D-heptose 1-phosphate adenosyltransferase
MKKTAGVRWVAVSGGFDPLHIGHVRLFKAARALCDKLVVILNNDNWLRAKKGFTFMSQRERAEIIRSFTFVDKVVITDHKKNDPDTSISRTLEKIQPAIFANGGDRKNVKDIPEAAVCKKYGIKMVFNVGHGGKVQSSSWMIEAARKPASKTVRPWGEYFAWDKGKGWNLKTIYIKPQSRLSLQYHHHREEWWLLVQGDAQATTGKGGDSQTIELKKGEVFRVGKKQVHRLSSKKGGIVVEVAYGDFDEADIVRLEDDHGRAKKST